MEGTYLTPLLCTRGIVVFPRQEIAIDVGRSQSKAAVDKAKEINSLIFVAAQKELNIDHPVNDDIYEVGTLCKMSTFRRKDGFYRINFIGQARARIKRHLMVDAIESVEVEVINDFISDETVAVGLASSVLVEMEQLRKRQAQNSLIFDFFKTLKDGLNPGELSDYYSQAFLLDYVQKQKYLEETDVVKRLSMVLESIKSQKQIIQIETEIDDRVRSHMEEGQKEYYLREKLKAIKDELNEGSSMSDTDVLREKLENNPYPEHVKKKALEEISKLEMLSTASGEFGVVRTYIEWLLNIPWSEKTQDNEDLNNAKEILDADHYGLDKVKERILEYLAVKQMTQNLKSPILCLVGPPGVGKTSLAMSVARALNRKFAKASLGGVKDESEIRGHRRTYLGSMPGRIIQGMKKAGVLNPVFLLDEIDKMASDYKGDPSSAMLEVLDPEQNSMFSDHYIEEPYDLSDVLFIATANYIENIPAALKDRLEIIELSSYTELEKVNIAKEHLVKKQMELNGLKASQFSIADDVIMYLIRHYTREAGVRQLERIIGSLCRKSVLAILRDGKKKVTVTKKLVKEYLGAEIFEHGTKEKKDQVGVVTGLAYTAFGGDVLAVEVNYFKGSGKFIVTGQLGDVMKESTRIALDYIKANADKYKIDPEFFDKHDIHIHVPEGAVPKDGPSAGVTLTTAMVSAFTGIKVKSNVAMTGEVTLRGMVLAIGGLKEKSLAAHRSGIDTILFPKANIKDLEEVPETVKEAINFIPCDKVSDVIKLALVDHD